MHTGGPTEEVEVEKYLQRISDGVLPEDRREALAQLRDLLYDNAQVPPPGRPESAQVCPPHHVYWRICSPPVVAAFLLPVQHYVSCHLAHHRRISVVTASANH